MTKVQDRRRPPGFRWRSNRIFILATVAVGLFTDLFLYALVVPFLPFMLRDRLSIPESQLQTYTSAFLAAFSAAAVFFSVPAGLITDRIGLRQPPFLVGVALLLGATAMLMFARTIALVVVSRLVQGAAAAIVWSTGFAIIQDTVGPNRLGQAIGTIFPVMSVGELLGPILGGVLYEKTGNVGVFAVAAGVIAIDFFMRLVVIDPRTARTYDSPCASESSMTGSFVSRPTQGEKDLTEDTTVPRNAEQYEGFRIKRKPGKLLETLPVLYCFHQPRFLAAMLLSFIHSFLMGAVDATVPIESETLFQFSSLQAGLLFIAFVVPFLAFGPLPGMVVDRYGTKIVATAGYVFLVPCLALLGLPSRRLITGTGNLVLYCVILALNGVGMSAVSSTSFVEASDVTQIYLEANPGLFGENGPYAQLYGFNSIFLFSGLAVGPLVSGALRDSLGYTVLTCILAGLSGIAAVLSYFVIGQRRIRALN